MSHVVAAPCWSQHRRSGWAHGWWGIAPLHCKWLALRRSELCVRHVAMLAALSKWLRRSMRMPPDSSRMRGTRCMRQLIHGGGGPHLRAAPPFRQKPRPQWASCEACHDTIRGRVGVAHPQRCELPRVPGRGGMRCWPAGGIQCDALMYRSECALTRTLGQALLQPSRCPWLDPSLPVCRRAGLNFHPIAEP